MSIELTPAQQHALDEHKDEPLPLVDPRTRETFFLVRAEDFDRISALLESGEDDVNMRQVAILVERAMREEDEGDPALETYQKYRNP